MNLPTKQKQSYMCRKHTDGYQGIRGGGGIRWEMGVDINAVLYVEWITNKNLLWASLVAQTVKNLPAMWEAWF